MRLSEVNQINRSTEPVVEFGRRTEAGVAAVRSTLRSWSRATTALAIVGLIAGACQTGVPAGSSASPVPASSETARPSVSPSVSLSTPTPSLPPIALPTIDSTPISALPPPSMYPADGPLAVDKLGLVLTDRLILRGAPGTGSERLGVLPKAGEFLVLAGPEAADGYDWYQIAALPHADSGCGSDAAALECTAWLGWAAAASPAGERWLGLLAIDCPVGRDTAAYLSMIPQQQLACAGSGDWHLRVFLARYPRNAGCAPAWITEPTWLDGPCNLVFPQPQDSDGDPYTRLQAFVPPSLGHCEDLGQATCVLNPLVGTWVELTGHLDDPMARQCYVRATGLSVPPEDPPTPDWVVLNCRLRLVVTMVESPILPGVPMAPNDPPPGLPITTLPFSHNVDVSHTLPDARGTGHCGGHDKDVWYTYTADQDGTLAVDTFGSTYDTVLDVWTWPLNMPIDSANLDSGLESMVAVACNDNANGLPTSEVVFAGTAGRTYVIRVSLGTFGTGLLNFHLSRG